jgi:hypothetical protein
LVLVTSPPYACLPHHTEHFRDRERNLDRAKSREIGILMGSKSR